MRTLRLPAVGHPMLLSAYAAGELGPLHRVSLKAHLRGCEPCRRYVEQLVLVRAAAAELGPGAISPDLRAALDTAHARWRVEHVRG